MADQAHHDQQQQASAETAGADAARAATVEAIEEQARAVRAERRASTVQLRTGKVSCFTVTDGRGRTVPVWYYLPDEFDPEECDASEGDLDDETDDEAEEAAEFAEEAGGDDDSDVAGKDEEPIEDAELESLTEFMFPSMDVLFVLHGVLRNAEQYCRAWARHAKAFNFLLVCPEFSNKDFPGEKNYNFGAVRRKYNQWTFQTIERIFKTLNRSGISRSGYHLYGHSAGAQFVHRFATFMPRNCHLVSAVAANAGWYTLPLLKATHPWPYSLQDAPVELTDDQIEHVLGRSLTILLGQEDLGHKFLRQTPAAQDQGANRFERGLNYFLRAKAEAKRRRVPFRWLLKTVPMTDHVNRLMAVAACKELFAQHPDKQPSS